MGAAVPEKAPPSWLPARHRAHCHAAQGRRAAWTYLRWAGTADVGPTCVRQEKRKRDQGKATSGKNFVEEEKRLARAAGVYSGQGFD